MGSRSPASSASGSLIIGSAGAAFMATFQARALAAATKKTADNVAVKIKDPNATTEERPADNAKKAIRSAGDSGIGNPDPADF